jgi:NTE family protein
VIVSSHPTFTLVLSAGFFGFYAHAGFLDALVSSGMRPSAIAGCSAGALIGGCYASGLEPSEIRRFLIELRRQHFWDPGPGAGLLRGERLQRFLADTLPIHDMGRTRIPIRLVVWDLLDRRSLVIEHGNLLTAMRASAAFPFLFQPVALRGRRLLDGGIGDRAALSGARPGERVLLHWLVSSSPWRKGDITSSIPAVSSVSDRLVDLGGFQRLGPFRMQAGMQVYDDARERTLRWLESNAATLDPWLTSKP